MEIVLWYEIIDRGTIQCTLSKWTMMKRKKDNYTVLTMSETINYFALHEERERGRRSGRQEVINI